MTAFEFDWAYMRRSTLVPAICAAVAIIVLAAAYWFHNDQWQRFSRLNANNTAIQEDYDALVYRRELVNLYHRRYLQFREIGFVGRESRLDWLEALRTITTQLTLPRVSYAIEPQLRAVAPVESIMAADDIQVFQSSLELQIGLLHELDLLRFFDELQSKAPGLIKVDSCDLAWQAGQQDALRAEANILAGCSIKIFSVTTSDVVVEAGP